MVLRRIEEILATLAQQVPLGRVASGLKIESPQRKGKI
jgi:hypothetical protein